jgi:hypothetical protein
VRDRVAGGGGLHSCGSGQDRNAQWRPLFFRLAARTEASRRLRLASEESKSPLMTPLAFRPGYAYSTAVALNLGLSSCKLVSLNDQGACVRGSEAFVPRAHPAEPGIFAHAKEGATPMSRTLEIVFKDGVSGDPAALLASVSVPATESIEPRCYASRRLLAPGFPRGASARRSRGAHVPCVPRIEAERAATCASAGRCGAWLLQYPGRAAVCLSEDAGSAALAPESDHPRCCIELLFPDDHL